MPEFEYLTAREVSALLRVHDDTLRRWRKAGQGPPAIRIGGSYRYPKADVDAYLGATSRGAR